MTRSNNDLEEKSAARRIFGKIFSAFKIYLMLTGLLVLLAPIMLGILSSRLSSSKDRAEPLPESPFLLHVSVSGELEASMKPQEPSFFSVLFEPKRSVDVFEIGRVMEYAAQDDKVLGLLVELKDVTGNHEGFSELRRALEKFKASGKPLKMHLNGAGNGEYQLATVAEEINMVPGSGFYATGPVITLAYFAETLRKLGVEFTVFQTGPFKSAFEAFIRDTPSQETLDIMGGLEGSIRSHMIEVIASSRGIPVNLADAWLKQGIFSTADALQAGIIDSVGYLNELKETFEEDLNTEESVTYSHYLGTVRANFGDIIERGEDSSALAVIEAKGNIELYSEDDPLRESDVITPDKIIPELQWAGEDDEIKAVVLRIDSPGGSATASDIIWSEIERLAEKKPVVVSMGGAAASGGYYMAAPATKIVAEPTTITGSIGVISAIPVLSGAKEKYGVSFHTITQSDRARLFNPAQRPSDFDRALLETTLKEFYDIFLSKVAKGRNMAIEDVAALAEGRVYTGLQALENGLVDDIGGFDTAFRLAKELAGLDASKRYTLKHYEPTDRDFLSCLMRGGNSLRCLPLLGAQMQSTTFMPQLLGQKESRLYPLLDKKQSRELQGWLDLVLNEQHLALMPLQLRWQ